MSLSGSVCLDRLHLSRSVLATSAASSSEVLPVLSICRTSRRAPGRTATGSSAVLSTAAWTLGVAPSVPCHGFWHAG